MSLIANTFKTAPIQWFPFTTTRASDDTKLLPLIDLAACALIQYITINTLRNLM